MVHYDRMAQPVHGRGKTLDGWIHSQINASSQLLDIRQISLVDIRCLLVRPGDPEISSCFGDFFEQSARLYAPHCISWIAVRIGHAVSKLDDPLLLGITSRIVCCIRLENGKRVIRELWL